MLLPYVLETLLRLVGISAPKLPVPALDLSDEEGKEGTRRRTLTLSKSYEIGRRPWIVTRPSLALSTSHQVEGTKKDDRLEVCGMLGRTPFWFSEEYEVPGCRFQPPTSYAGGGLHFSNRSHGVFEFQ